LGPKRSRGKAWLLFRPVERLLTPIKPLEIKEEGERLDFARLATDPPGLTPLLGLPDSRVGRSRQDQQRAKMGLNAK
jgi:hypothetical protein